MAYITQTERDTARANSRVTRSDEYQRRVDAADAVTQVGTTQGNIEFHSSYTTASSGGGSSFGGFLIYLAGVDEPYFISVGYATSDYEPSPDPSQDDWYLEFGVTNSALDALDITGPDGNGDYFGSNPSQVAGGARYDLDENDEQTCIRVPIIEKGQVVCVGGTFRENVFCANGVPIVELIRIG